MVPYAPFKTRPDGSLSRVLRWIAAPCLLLLTSCATSEEPVVLEVLTWWKDPSESEAFRQVANHLPSNIELNDPGLSSSIRTRSNLAATLFANKPPSSFQANLGADVLRWNQVEFTNRVTFQPELADPYLEALDDSFSGLTTKLDVGLIENLTLDSKLYAVPINIHRLNLLYFNQANAVRFKEEHGRDLVDLAVLCPTDRSGTPPFRTAIGLADTFMLVQLVFEALLPALHGETLYRQLFIEANPQPDWQADMRDVLSCYEYMARSFVGDIESKWGTAVDLVREGQAADLTVTGDWATGKLAGDYPSIVGSAPFPETDTLFIYTSDTFSLPIGAPNRSQTLLFLHAVANPEVQVSFSKSKGSIPAYADANDALIGEFAVETRQAFHTTTRLLATSGVLPPYYPLKELGIALNSLARDAKLAANTNQEPPSIEPALQWIVTGQHLIEKWKQRAEVTP